MLYLFLDESGDLGFDFVQKRPSSHFVVTIMYVCGSDNRKKIKFAVRRTLKKLNSRKGKKRMVEELKGTDTIIEVKKYFYDRLSDAEFGIYSVILNKKRVFRDLTFNKERLYNYISRILLNNIPVSTAKTALELVCDKCKGKPEIKEFNDYILRNLESRIDPKVPIYFNHHDSREVLELQATDLFSWGIFRKYCRKDLEWYAVFAKERVKFEEVYLR